jgi:hypothetical protein
MTRILAGILALLFLIASPAQAQQAVFSYQNITTDTTTTIKSSRGMLHSVCINTPAATGTATIYDNTAASGTKIGTITSFANIVGCQLFDVAFWTGLTIVTATAAPDITVSFR